MKRWACINVPLHDRETRSSHAKAHSGSYARTACAGITSTATLLPWSVIMCYFLKTVFQFCYSCQQISGAQAQGLPCRRNDGWRCDHRAVADHQIVYPKDSVTGEHIHMPASR